MTPHRGLAIFSGVGARTPPPRIDPGRALLAKFVTVSSLFRTRNFRKRAFPDRSLGGEFRLTFRVHDLSHNEVQNWRRQCGQHCSQRPRKWPISSAAVTFVSLSLLIDNALYEK